MPSQQSPIINQPLAKLLFATLALLLMPTGSFGQTAITAWTLGSSDAANTTAYSPTTTFQNSVFNVTSFTAGTTKTVDSSATSTFIRRSGAGGNSNLWMVQNGAIDNLRGINPSTGTLADVLSGNNVLQGGNDLFVNTGGSPTTVNTNVERVDFAWAGGFTTVSDQGFAVFDRGSNDGFQIAVITGWNSSTNAPTAYGATKEVAATSYGANLAADWVAGGGTETTFTATALRFTSDTTLSTLSSSQSVGGGLGGVFVSFADLGIADGTTIYGYSIMATDVTNTLADLVDWTNASFYPTNTPDSAVGSIDLAGFNGRRFVPEPATYGALLLFLSVAAVALHRRKIAVPVKVRA